MSEAKEITKKSQSSGFCLHFAKEKQQDIVTFYAFCRKWTMRPMTQMFQWPIARIGCKDGGAGCIKLSRRTEVRELRTLIEKYRLDHQLF